MFKTDFPQLVKDDFPASDTGPWPPTAMFWKSCHFRRYKWQRLSLWSMPPSDQIVCSMSIGPSRWGERPERLCRPPPPAFDIYIPVLSECATMCSVPANNEGKPVRGIFLLLINRIGIWEVSIYHFLFFETSLKKYKHMGISRLDWTQYTDVPFC